MAVTVPGVDRGDTTTGSETLAEAVGQRVGFDDQLVLKLNGAEIANSPATDVWPPVPGPFRLVTGANALRCRC